MHYLKTLSNILSLAALLFASTGCMHQLMTQGAKEQIAEAIVNKGFGPSFQLQGTVLAFRFAKKRWPKNQDELSKYITNSKLEPIPYDHVDFIKTENGGVTIYAKSSDVTNTINMNMSIKHIDHK